MIKKIKKSRVHSSYWLSDWENDSILTRTLSETEKNSHNIYKLSAAKRAISNFVNIVTNQQIPVTFNEQGQSYTDGDRVVIGVDVIEPKDFDIVVGLALHEGSHIKLSDFKILKELSSRIPISVGNAAEAIGLHNYNDVIKNVLNYIEDRRIDYYVYNQAPGYREYYRSMYNKYWYSKEVDKGLLSSEFREENVDSYMFRIINLHNENSQLDALGGLKEIHDIINLGNIQRLTSTQDAFDVSLKVFDVILKNIENAVNSQSENGEGDEGGDGNGEKREMTDEEFGDLLDQVDNESNGSATSGDGDEEQSSDGSSKNGEAGNSKQTKKVEVTLTEKQMKLLKKKIKEQKKFLDGSVTKKTISKEENEKITEVEHSGSEIQTVGTSLSDGYGNTRGTSCIVVKKMTKSLMESDVFPMASKAWKSSELNMDYADQIADGIRIGTLLGKKLQLRGESRTTVFNRQKVGKLDKRLVASLGFGNENVFSFNDVDSYKKANLHISIDASGSMAGTKWRATLTNVTAMCKAVDMISNLEIQVSFRTTTDSSPYIVLAYDSRVDKFSKVKQLFPALRTNGTTPEGLTFEAILKEFIPMNNDMDSFFINISDGMPYFSNNDVSYQGQIAYKHTRKMIKLIEGMGISVLSYFLGDSYETKLSSDFIEMYGVKNSAFIDVTNVSEVTKTVNGLFMKKEKK